MDNTIDRQENVVLVIGATGNQGGAAARHLLADGWRVRALVRDSAAPKAVALAAGGAELIRGDLTDEASLRKAVAGAHGVFSVLAADEHEVVLGKSVADMAEAEGVRHLVYSSVGGVESQNRYYLDHGWGPVDKWVIERHLRGLSVPLTLLRPGGFMEDFTSPARFFQNGSINVPWHDDLVMNLIAVDDIGVFASLAFADPATYVGATLELAGDRLRTPQIADAFSAATGRAIPHSRVSLELLWRRSPEAARVFTWANETYFETDPAGLRSIYPDLMDLRVWLNRSGTARVLAQLCPSPTS